MNIILKFEQKVVEDIVYILKRLPFQPHFLIDLEEQLETQLARPVEPVDPPVDIPVDPIPAIVVTAPVDAPPVG